MASQDTRVTLFKNVDRMPVLPQEIREFSDLAPEARAAAYLKSIRRMMVFFTVITAVGLVAAVVLGIIDVLTLSSIHQSQVPPGNPFG